MKLGESCKDELLNDLYDICRSSCRGYPYLFKAADAFLMLGGVSVFCLEILRNPDYYGRNPYSFSFKEKND
jgi:hypothetical protein